MFSGRDATGVVLSWVTSSRLMECSFDQLFKLARCNVQRFYML